jgi:predicted SAM-dependent methyltransferase
VIRPLAKRLAVRVLSFAKAPLGKARFHIAVAHREGLMLAIGCGRTRLSGWICTDVSWRARFYLDVLSSWPLQPGSVSRVYGDNVIEHFKIDEAREVLTSSYKALAPGGRIRLATPDVGRIAHMYLHDPELTEEVLARHRSVGYLAPNPVDVLRVTFCESGHHLGYLFDFASLDALLREAGFEDVIRCEVGQSRDGSFVGLESRTGKAEAATMLVVEATKV